MSGFVKGGYVALSEHLNTGKKSAITGIHDNDLEREILSYQGLLTPEAIYYIPIKMLLARAAFLRDTDMYLYFAPRYWGAWSSKSQDLALISDVPEIKRLLSLSPEGSWIRSSSDGLRG